MRFSFFKCKINNILLAGVTSLEASQLAQLIMSCQPATSAERLSRKLYRNSGFSEIDQLSRGWWDKVKAGGASLTDVEWTNKARITSGWGWGAVIG